jgi:LmbE family N-acetylglucosaminyl deacetylase
MKAQFNNVLALAPHTDDAEFGCGGTLARLLDEGANVYYAAFSTAEKSVPPGFPHDVLKTEVKEATRCLGIEENRLFIFNYEVRKLNYCRQEILEDLIKIRSSIDFDLILMPSLNDIHQDHLTVAQEALRAFKNKTILGYELLWNNLSFNTVAFFPLSQEYIAKKALAISMYRSQAHRPYASEEFIFSLARSRGVQIGCEFAETFEVVRWVLH